MSTGRRLAKRSILGTRVSAPGQDGRYHPAFIQATKMNGGVEGQQPSSSPSSFVVYSVVFDDDGGKISRDFRDDELIGPGFANIASVKLRPGQKVYVTHNGREVDACVLRHDGSDQVVRISVDGGAVELDKKLDEVRLLESRKSARLHDQDYSRLADCGNGSSSSSCNGVATTGRSSRVTSHVIDVPAAAQNNRKRRPSSPDDVDVMDDCAAAMVLMSLSCSPKSPRLPENGVFHSWTSDAVTSSLRSPSSSSSGASSWPSGGTRTPSPTDLLSASAPASFRILSAAASSCSAVGGGDEGIDDDHDSAVPRKRRYSNRTVFKCTWPGCGRMTRRCHEIEEHVRKTHLRKMEDLGSREEEFYFTEMQLPVEALMLDSLVMTSSPPPTLSHLDMARPAHEDPEYQQRHHNNHVQHHHHHHLHHQVSLPNKCVARLAFGGGGGGKVVTSHRKSRGDSKKCRKVYGMENRDLWCTQCKWKKACSRFMD